MLSIMDSSCTNNCLSIAFSSPSCERTAWTPLETLINTPENKKISAKSLHKAYLKRNPGSTKSLKDDVNIHIRRIVQTSWGSVCLWKCKCKLQHASTIRASCHINYKNNRTPVKLIYFLNTTISNRYSEIFLEHLLQLSESKVDKDRNFSLCLILVGPQEEEREIRKYLQRLLPSLFNLPYWHPRLKIIRIATSTYEYEGLLTTWNESFNHDGLIMYAHCKGVSHIESTGRRNVEEICASTLLLRHIYINIDIMASLPSLTRLGCVAGGGGWMWFNFWMAQAKYISSLEKPIKTTRRHYYEDWLCRKLPITIDSIKNTSSDVDELPLNSYELDLTTCYGLLTNRDDPNIAKAYEASTAIELATKKSRDFDLHVN